jgi:hypothetical protein
MALGCLPSDLAALRAPSVPDPILSHGVPFGLVRALGGPPSSCRPLDMGPIGPPCLLHERSRTQGCDQDPE